MSKFRKKPVTVDAVQFFYDKPWPEGVTKADDGEYCVIYTLEGRMRCTDGDWIVTGVNGERYPCKPDIFAKTYDPADPPAGDAA